MMDPKRNEILQDLTRSMIERILKEAEGMASMCKMVNIPQHEYEVATSSAFLYCFMELLSSSKPTMTSHELGQIVEAQYRFYRELEHDSKLNELISEIQMLSLTLSTQSDPESRRVTLYKIREKSWEANDEIVMKELPILIPITIRPKKVKFGVNDL